MPRNIGRARGIWREDWRTRAKTNTVRSLPLHPNKKLTAVGWRLKSRMKTFNAGMFICLNLGVDPPDVVKTNPCAKLECWLDPTALPSSKAIEAIGRSAYQGLLSS